MIKLLTSQSLTELMHFYNGIELPRGKLNHGKPKIIKLLMAQKQHGHKALQYQHINLFHNGSRFELFLHR